MYDQQIDPRPFVLHYKNDCIVLKKIFVAHNLDLLLFQQTRPQNQENNYGLLALLYEQCSRRSSGL